MKANKTEKKGGEVGGLPTKLYSVGGINGSRE